MGAAGETKWVYNFGGGRAEGSASMKNLLGGKGANLNEMASLGLPVPPGFTISTEVCTHFYANKKTYPTDLADQVEHGVRQIESHLQSGDTSSKREFGSRTAPLLVSVRSGARASMPGMMDTVLNLGLNDTTTEALRAETNDARFAYDSYRRFIQMYADVVMQLDRDRFENALEAHKTKKGYKLDTEMSGDDWQEMIVKYKKLVRELSPDGKEFPQDVWKQLWGAIGAVFGSWNNARAITYRKMNGFPDAWGTAVSVQAMVYGNMGDDCSTGVCFSRNPATGDSRFYGEYLVNAQGEDVVAGIRTPQPLTTFERELKKTRSSGAGEDLPSMEETLPKVYKELVGFRNLLEKHYRDMQDMEFTVQKNRLFILQTRTGKRTAMAALKIACDMVREGLISKEEAISRIDPKQLDQLLHPTLDPTATREVIAQGLPASPGAASGHIVFTAEDAERWVQSGGKPRTGTEAGERRDSDVYTSKVDGHLDVRNIVDWSDEKANGSDGHTNGVQNPTTPKATAGAKKGFHKRTKSDTVKVILVRKETSPEDISGMHVSQGVLTARGGMTSHAAVVARGMGTPCVAGAQDIVVDVDKKIFIAGGRRFTEGDIITLDGASGEVMAGEVPTVEPNLGEGDFSEFMEWVDEFRTLGVRANAETPEDAQAAVDFGCEGIGLTRTEHMFFDPERIVHVREMILAEDKLTREKALSGLLPYQRSDFKTLFRILDGRPATIRLLDPPLHEFLPHTEAEMQDVVDAINAAGGNVTLERLKKRQSELSELNPMLGHRGCRLAVTYPEICEMQSRAIFEAAIFAARDFGIKPKVEVMVPLIATKHEMDHQAAIIKSVVAKVKAEYPEYSNSFTYKIGTMIELPRACLRAADVARSAEFFSFGTNDLTQTTFGFSRDDAASFIEDYLKQGLLVADPFVSIDREGVGELVKMAAEGGRSTRPGIHLGICGEHGGDPASVRFCHEIGLTYVSCSPYRVPIARLAAAQAAIDSNSS